MENDASEPITTTFSPFLHANWSYTQSSTFIQNLQKEANSSNFRDCGRLHIEYVVIKKNKFWNYIIFGTDKPLKLP